MPRIRILLAAAAMTAACMPDTRATTGPGAGVAAVVGVVPASGASAVSRTAPVVVTFDHSMMQGMEMNVVLHEGSVTGAVVQSSAGWSPDRRVLTLLPSAPLKASSVYVLHLAPTIVSASGQPVNHAACASLGALSVTSGMTGGGMMSGGSMGPGMSGSGWQMANGGYGMIFSFTTGA